MRVLFPPRDVDEEPRLEVRHHHIRQVRDDHVCQVRHASFRIPLPCISLNLVCQEHIFAWSYLLLNSPGRSTSLAFACTVDSLRCWNQAGRGETIPTSCSSGLFQREIHKKRKCALVRYEELKQDQEKMVRKIADFIGYSLSEQQIQAKHVVAKFDPFQSSSLGHN